ncbi:hypothetical protein Dda_1632 [Drechslerella dactyloides]|uniref:Uncharacterized protein n=1 Tax=Drechslerella dactyloides TaxID=74499 RepID=A0AAD6J294_DREDA|nr:hypothetical protein Dda_1632 [Drechslerella dactyloides]
MPAYGLSTSWWIVEKLDDQGDMWVDLQGQSPGDWKCAMGRDNWPASLVSCQVPHELMDVHRRRAAPVH